MGWFTPTGTIGKLLPTRRTQDQVFNSQMGTFMTYTYRYTHAYVFQTFFSSTLSSCRAAAGWIQTLEISNRVVCHCATVAGQARHSNHLHHFNQEQRGWNLGWIFNCRVGRMRAQNLVLLSTENLSIFKFEISAKTAFNLLAGGRTIDPWSLS